jgi:hypothetical protein
MSNPALEAVIREHCRELKLGAIVREYPALCRRAQDSGRPYEEFLHELLVIFPIIWRRVCPLFGVLEAAASTHPG